MHHYAKRLLALFLALLLCLSLFPAAALAEETEEPAAPAEDGVPGEGPGEDDPPAEGELPEITAEDPVSLDEGADPAALPPAEDETEEAAASGACGDSLTWTLEDGVLTISGSGDMWDWSAGGAPWYGRRSEITRVVIEPGVTSLGDCAFIYCSSLTSVTIPEGVTSIGGWAFYYCRSLTSVTIPGSVTSIGNYAFQSCSRLSAVTIPEGVTSIGDYAFSDCRRLTAILVAEDNSVYASQDGILYTRDMTTLIQCAGGKTGTVTIPEGVTVIGNCAFECCYSLSGVTIPEGVTSIGNSAFFYCKNLTSVTIPGSVTSIGNNAFKGCSSLTAVTIPGSVTSIGGGAFSSCSGLGEIRFEGPAPSFGSDIFSGVTATAYYPSWEPSWTESVRQNYGGTITWVPYDGYTVSYDANGGEGAPEAQHAAPGATLRLSGEIPTRQGYLFLGWARDGAAAESEYQPGDACTLNEDLTLYAVWAADPAAAGTIVLEGGSVLRGDEIRVPVRLENNPGVVSVEFTVRYDETVLEWIGVEEGEYGGFFDAEVGGPITWFAEDTTEDITEDGILATLVFKAGENAPASITEVTVLYGEDKIFDSHDVDVDFAVQPAEIRVMDHIPGDVNGDGEVNNKDVTRLISYLKHGAAAVEAALDVNGDGKVNNKDVSRLIGYIKHGNVTIH